MYFDKQFVESGGLMSYGANVADLSGELLTSSH
jgi:hypothetical protein